MTAMFVALARSLGSLRAARVWGYLLVPTLSALCLTLLLWFLALDVLSGWLLGQPPLTWVAAWGALWLAHLIAALGGWLLILSASYLLAVLLTGIVVMPMLLNHLAQTDYADLARMGDDSVIASTWSNLWAAGLFIIGFVLTLPLWLVPGLGFFHPLFWMAWLNRRTFTYDALSVHATPDELGQLRRQHSGGLLALGGLMAMLTHVPFAGLFAPALAALSFSHYCLQALRGSRQGAVATIPPSQEKK